MATHKGHWHMELFLEYGLLLPVTHHKPLKVSINRLWPLEGRRGLGASVQPVTTQKHNRRVRDSTAPRGHNHGLPYQGRIPHGHKRPTSTVMLLTPRQNSSEAGMLRRRRRRWPEGGRSIYNRIIYRVPDLMWGLLLILISILPESY